MRRTSQCTGPGWSRWSGLDSLIRPQSQEACGRGTLQRCNRCLSLNLFFCCCFRFCFSVPGLDGWIARSPPTWERTHTHTHTHISVEREQQMTIPKPLWILNSPFLYPFLTPADSHPHTDSLLRPQRQSDPHPALKACSFNAPQREISDVH